MARGRPSIEAGPGCIDEVVRIEADKEQPREVSAGLFYIHNALSKRPGTVETRGGKQRQAPEFSDHEDARRWGEIEWPNVVTANKKEGAKGHEGIHSAQRHEPILQFRTRHSTGGEVRRENKEGEMANDDFLHQ